MAPPPKYLISRRLVKRFFDRFLPKEPEGTSQKMDQLWNIYDSHGFESPVAKAYEKVYDKCYREGLSYRNRVGELHLKQTVSSKLTKPEFKITKKGRFHKTKTKLPPTIFDGVK